jgi:hypothetical protein
LDYQLVEEEQESLSKLVLLVDPSVGAVDEGAMRQIVLERLSGGLMGNYMTQVIERMGALEIRRGAPKATAIGKVMPLHYAKSTGREEQPLAR